MGAVPAWARVYVPVLLAGAFHRRLPAAATALCDAVPAAAMAHARTRWPFGPLLRNELRALPGIGSAARATGVVMALAVGVVGLWALPVLALPPLLAQRSFRHYAAVRTTYRQTIASLARAAEIAGYAPAGQVRRVAVLSREAGRGGSRGSTSRSRPPASTRR